MSVSIEACITLLKKEFETEEVGAQIDEFLKRALYSPKWMLYSDYCLDDQTKHNDVITFVMIPFINEDQYQALDRKIAETQPKDIKKVRSVNDAFMDYFKEQTALSFSFIVNNRQELFGTTEDEQVKTVTQILTNLKQTFITWRDNADTQSQKDYYMDVIDRIKRQEREIFLKKKVKQHIDILLITIFGAYYTAAIMKRLPNVQIFGWFPDRDKTNEACDELAVPIFNALQYGYMDSRLYQFCAGKPDSTIVPFYDNENRIADVICGTLADYDIQNNLVSKDKFSEVLEGLMADNLFIKIYRFFVDGDRLHMGTIKISSLPL